MTTIWEWQSQVTLSVCWTMTDSNTPIVKSRDRSERHGRNTWIPKIQTWLFLWRPIKTILRQKTGDGRRSLISERDWTQQGVNLLDQDRLDFAEAAKHVASGLVNERALWIRVCSKEAFRARFCDADWEQHFEIWSVDSVQDSIAGEFGDGSIGSSTAERTTEIRENFWVLEQVRDGDVSIKKEKKRSNVATIRKTKPIVAVCTTIF